jgi:hypothetical protein
VVAVTEERAESHVIRPEETASEGTVITRNRHIHLRTFVPADLDDLAEWAEDPVLEHLVGSEFLRSYRNVDKDPAFYEAVVTDPTQVVLMIMANQGWARPVGGTTGPGSPRSRRARRARRRAGGRSPRRA